MEGTGTLGVPQTYADRLYATCKKAIEIVKKILTVGIRILVGVGCFALQPNFAVTVSVISFCTPGMADQVRQNMDPISKLFTWQKAEYAALVVFLAWYALPVAQCMLTAYFAIQLGITLRKQLQVEAS